MGLRAAWPTSPPGRPTAPAPSALSTSATTSSPGSAVPARAQTSPCSTPDIRTTPKGTTMKKLLGTLVAGAVILVPTAAMAGTTSTTTSTDTGAGVIADPIFVVSPTPLPDAQPAPVVPVLTPKE